MEDLDARIAELQKQLDEAKKAKALAPVVVLINRMSKVTGKLSVKLSKVDYTIVDFFRRFPDRTFLSTQEENEFKIGTFDNVLAGLQNIIQARMGMTGVPQIELKWKDGLEAEYKEYMARPDINIILDPKQKDKVNLELGPRWAYGQRIYLSEDITTLTYNPNKHGYEMAVGELYKLPTQIEKLYSNMKVVYSEEVKEIILAQIERRRVVSEVATAMDWPDVPNPFINGLDLKPLQRVAVKFAELVGDNCIIAYPMGKGKTSISGAISKLRGYKKNLVVCPAPGKTNWRREIEKFLGEDALILQGAQPDAHTIDHLIKNPNGYKWFIINYDIMARAAIEEKNEKGEVVETVNMWSTVLKLAQFDAMYVDEAHRIKNTDSKRSKAVMDLAGIPHKITLTGTPIVNRPSELYPLLHLASPQTFNSEALFSNLYMERDGSPKNVKKLHEILSQFMIRRTPEQFGDASIERIPYTKELSPQARALYNKILEGVYISLRNPNYQRDITSILAELMRCKQTCANDNVETSADLALEALEETDKKVLVFSQFKEPQAAIRSIIGTSASIINGDVGDERRYELVDEFQNPQSRLKVIVTNITEILTLTEAHTVIFNDIWWTPKDHQQAEGRAFNRTNDPHGGNAYYLQNENTIDTFLVDLLARKLAIAAEVIDGVPNEQAAQGSLAMDLIEHLRGSL